MKIFVATLIFAAAICSAQAQTRSHCKMLAESTAQMINGVAPMANAVDELAEHVPAMKKGTSGQARASLEKFDEKRRQLAVALREYLSASREMRNSFEACS